MKIGILMDNLAQVNPKRDSNLALLKEAARRGYEIYYFNIADLYLDNNHAYANCKLIEVMSTPPFFKILAEQKVNLAQELDCLLFRKEPPVDLEFIYATQILDLAAQQGLKIVNPPNAVRDCNEKLFSLWPQETFPPTLVTCNIQLLKEFLRQHQEIIVKPLNSMGGASIFKVSIHDPNTNVILETITQSQQTTIMAQKFIADIAQGDKRILFLNGEVIPFGIKRLPAAGDFRGNLKAQAQGVGFKLSSQDLQLCDKILPLLQKKQLFFVGIDVIGNYVTEINVTCPTCIVEIEQEFDYKITQQFFDKLI